MLLHDEIFGSTMMTVLSMPNHHAKRKKRRGEKKVLGVFAVLSIQKINFQPLPHKKGSGTYVRTFYVGT